MNNGHTNFTLIQESKNGSASKCLVIPVDRSSRLTVLKWFPAWFFLLLWHNLAWKIAHGPECFSTVAAESDGGEQILTLKSFRLAKITSIYSWIFFHSESVLRDNFLFQSARIFSSFVFFFLSLVYLFRPVTESVSSSRICLWWMLCYLAVGIKSPFQRRKPKNTILLKKQVKFTDELKCSDILAIAAENNKEDEKTFADQDPLQGRCTAIMEV